MKDSEAKLIDIKQYSEILYQYVLDKKIKLQDAYNLARSGIEMVSEYKGRGTKGRNKIGLSKEMDRIMKMYKPTITDLLNELKRLFPFTFNKHLK